MSAGMLFGWWLRQRRKSLDLTQAELARRVACSTVAIRKIEAGERRPSKQIAERLAELFAVPAAEWPAFVQFARSGALADAQTLPGELAEFAPWRARRRPLGGRPPALLTPLIGRERELAAARRMLSNDTRLLTFVGPPGIGKTSLALQVAAELSHEFRDGACFVALAAVTDPEAVTPAIVQALGISKPGDQPGLESLKDRLLDRQLLLVLDNFEQVIEAAPVAHELLSACPELKVLATSRAALCVPGERQFPVPPLGLPSLEGLAASPALPAALLQYSAVRMFVERAQAVQPEFVLTAENAPAIAAICARLDGLPLAIELIAARTQLFPLSALAARLDGRFTLAADGMRGTPDRQKTLNNAIGWSYDLLNAGDRALFARLAVFVSGFTPEAAQKVCAAGSSAPSVLDGISSLLGKSLLRRESSGGAEPRFGMLQTIREYALERLAASGEAALLKRRHADFFLALAQTAEPELTGADQADWLERLETEHDNLRAALGWALEAGALETAARLAVSLRRFWLGRGYVSEGRQWMERTLAEPRAAALPALVRARLLNGTGVLAGQQGDYARAIQLMEQTLGLSREIGDRLGLAASLNNLALVLLEQAISLERAEALFTESLALLRELGHEMGIAITLYNLGTVASHRDDMAGAIQSYEASLSLSRQAGVRHVAAWCLTDLGRLALDQGDLGRAASLMKDSLLLKHELGDKETLPWTLEGLARLAEARGDAAGAAQLLGAQEALREAVGIPMPPVYLPSHEGCLAAVRASLAETTFAAAWAAGRALTPEQALAYALSAVHSAEGARAQG